jgi:hypothetical protein
MHRWSALSKNTKIIVGVGGVVASYAAYKALYPAHSQAGPMVAGRVMREHAIAAKDDVKKEASDSPPPPRL